MKKKGKGFINEFKKFALKGNVMDLAVGVIIGGAFQGIVNSVVNDIIMPLISGIFGSVDFSNWYLVLKGDVPAGTTLEAAKEMGAVTVNYGSFLTVLINFLILAIIIFLMVKGINRLNDIHKKPEEPKVETEKVCPYCKTKISIEAVRCPHCTSQLEEEKE